MWQPLRERSLSLSMVVFVLLVTLIMQEGVSYNVTLGALSTALGRPNLGLLSQIWLGVRGVVMLGVVVLWLLKRKRELFRAIIILNGLLTLGLTLNLFSLLFVLSGISPQDVRSLLIDVAYMAVTNLLIFSIWYWIIDPPGIEDTQRIDEPWEFLFPQRGADLPHYEQWQPRYSDYLFLAFTTSFAFSPTDTLPLTRRAKLLMMWQAAVSVITLTAIAGSAINILASGSQ